MIPEVVRKAFKVARAEKPGASFIDFPENIAAMSVQDKVPLKVQEPRPPVPPADKLDQAAAIITAASTPLIMAGNGVLRARATDALEAFAQRLDIPVTMTFMAKGAVARSRATSLGTSGLAANDDISCGFDRADVVICVGYDMVEYHPHLWYKNASQKIIHVDTLAAGAAEAGCWISAGEGGLSPYHLASGADVVFQIGTAKNGVRDLDGHLNDDKLCQIAAHPQVRMCELKLSQGAKPGKGGILPGAEVTEQIARIRGLRVGEDAISPNRYIDIGNNEQLLDVIAHVREVTGKPVGFKAVIGAYGWLDTLFEAVRQRGVESAPDFITVDGAEGGTGAAPMPLIDDMGLPLLVDKLTEHGLRHRVNVIASGKLITPADVAWALCIGADFVCTARGFMFALGCIQALQCNKNTCPTGITTHNRKLQKGLHPPSKAHRAAAYARNLVHEVGIIAHSCGVHSPREMRRFHAHVVQPNGLTVGLDQLYPEAAERP